MTRESLGLMVHRVLKVWLVLQEALELRVQTDRRDRKELAVLMVRKELKETRVLVEFKVVQEEKEMRVLQELPVLRVILVS